MASTSLAQQLQKLATPHSKLYVSKNKKLSLLFDSSEAASIDRATFYEIGISGFKELIELSNVFVEFQTSLFDVTSMNFERAVETSEVNDRLNRVIRRFLYLASPYFLLKPCQKVLEWLIARFHVHDYNTDDMICAALPYHGTLFFARLLQIFDLKNSRSKWHWLYPLQKKGAPLSKTALFHHCASETAFLKMICDSTVDALDILGDQAYKLTTLFGFYCTTIIGALQNMSEVTELHLTYMLPSIVKGISSTSVDFTSSALLIVAFILNKTSFHERLLRKLVNKISKINDPVLRRSVVLSLNILYQYRDLEESVVSREALKNFQCNADWFIPTLGEFLASGRFPNVFYYALVRDAVKQAISEPDEAASFVDFISNLFDVCRVDETSAEMLINTLVRECYECDASWCSELVQRLERQYPNTWDGVISNLLKTLPSGSLTQVLGLTSITSQVQLFNQLNSVEPRVRIEVIRWISENEGSVNVRYVESSLMSQWDDDDPSVIEAMFALPEQLRYFTPAVCDKLLLTCWRETAPEWNNVLVRVITSFKTGALLKESSTKYTVFLLPFLIHSNDEVRNLILETDLPFLKCVRHNLKTNINEAVCKTLKNSSVLPKIDELISLYDDSTLENVHVFTVLFLLSGAYKTCNHELKLKVLACIFERIFPRHIRKFKWKASLTWDPNRLQEYYLKTAQTVPREIVFHLFTCISEHTNVPKKLVAPGWCDSSDQHTTLINSLYEYLCRSSEFTDHSVCVSFVSLFLEKHLTVLSERIHFLCNMCLSHKDNDCVLIETFKVINSSLRNACDSFSWILKMNVDNTAVPTILIFSYSSNPELRKLVMETVSILCASLCSAIADEPIFVELLKHLIQFREEIIFDREQLPSVVYGFVAQDPDVQALLPASVRFLTRRILDGIFDCVTSESVPLSVSASLLPVVDFLQDRIALYRLIPLAKRVLHRDDQPDADGSAIVCSVIDKFNANEVNLLDENEPRDFLHYCVDNASKVKIRAKDGVLCLGTILLRKISTMMDASSEALQVYLIDSTLNMLVGCESMDLVLAANSFMKKITLNGEFVAPYLENMKKIDLGELLMTTKPKPIEWSMGIALLEIVQNKKKIKNCQAFLPLLFDVLQKGCEVDEPMSMEYAKQLCLSCALNCCQKLMSEIEEEGDSLKKRTKKSLEKSFNVELVVNCIRMSPNSQTHHHALMLLAYGASFAPGQVLHNIMAIFTFMGSSVLRQDDAFSFQIISNILDTIVPLLIQNEQKSSLSLCSVLRVFAVSIPDIPDHRRVPLLVRLMKILNDGEHLHLLLLFTLESAVKNNVKSTETKYMEAMAEVLQAMTVRQTLNCLQNVLVYANSLPYYIDKSTENVSSDNSWLDVSTFKSKELHHFKYLLLNFLSSTLSSTEFVQRVSVTNAAEISDLENDFYGMIEQIILGIKTISEYYSEKKGDSNKYWKVMMSQAVEVLNKTNALLTSGTFLVIAKSLINHKYPIVKRKTLELLNWRLQQNKDGTESDQFKTDELITMIPVLMKVINSISKSTSDDSNDVKLNQQTALISMKLLVKYFYAPEYASKFKKTLSKLAALIVDSDRINDHVLACLILAIAELTAALKVHAVEALPKFIPEYLSIFKRYHTTEILPNDILLLSVGVALQKLVETLSNFLSPYLEPILFEVAYVSARIESSQANKPKTNEDKSNTSIAHRMRVVRQKLAEIPPRVLLPSISVCFERLCEMRHFSGLEPLLSILVDSFPQKGHFSPELTSLFFTALDFRCSYGSDIDEDEIVLVEGTIIEALSQIVLKCSETTFRPFYHKLYDWGVIASKEPSKNERILAYYRTLDFISGKLKSIFVLFASNFMRNAAELLQKSNASIGDGEKLNFSENKMILLVDSILRTLFNVFRHDTVKFLTKDRFDLLCEPLVNQIENTIGDYSTRSKEIIIPCLARFAAASTDDSLLKHFNYQILLKTRHASSEVRLAALDTVVLLATHLGDNFLPFLPETVPFLAELLEDEDVVEKQTHKAVQKLEEVLGEQIQKYF